MHKEIKKHALKSHMQKNGKYKIHTHEIKLYLPCPSFNIAAVMNTLNTFLKTSSVKIEPGVPEPFQAMIIMAFKKTPTFSAKS